MLTFNMLKILWCQWKESSNFLAWVAFKFIFESKAFRSKVILKHTYSSDRHYVQFNLLTKISFI